MQVVQIESIYSAPFLVKNCSSQLVTLYQHKYRDNKICLEADGVTHFAWDNPFSDKYLALELQSMCQEKAKVFVVEIEQFHNQELRVDRQFNAKIDQEFTLEIYQDGFQKVIAVVEK